MLTKCLECQRKISEEATTCPHCGARDAGGMARRLRQLREYERKKDLVEPGWRERESRQREERAAEDARAELSAKRQQQVITRLFIGGLAVVLLGFVWQRFADEAFKPCHQPIEPIEFKLDRPGRSHKATPVLDSLGIVTDQATGLRLLQRDEDVRLDWPDATRHCAKLVQGGAGPWRLPTLREALSIVEPDYDRRTKTEQPLSPFENNGYNVFWTASPLPPIFVSTQAWALDYKSGEAFPAAKYKNKYSVRCVR